MTQEVMTTQEDVREGVKLWMIENDACHNSPCGKTKCNSECIFLNTIVDDFLDRLRSQGVVIRGDSLGGSHPHLADYFTVKPLIDTGG